MTLLDRVQCKQLLDILLLVVGSYTSGQRDVLLQDLPPDLKSNLELSNIPRLDLNNIINACNDYALPLNTTIDYPLCTLINNALHFLVAGAEVDPQLREFLKLAGCTGPHPLTAEYVKPLSLEQLEAFRAAHIDLRGEPLLRTSLADELTLKAENRALVVLHGRGGTGKSVILWQWLREKGPFLIIKASDEVYPNFVTDQVCNWARLAANDPRRTNSSIDEVLKHIDEANPNTPLPLLYIGIDGLDECIDPRQEAEIRTLFRWFWREDQRCQGLITPKAVLIVTCRRLEELIPRLPKDSNTGDPSQLLEQLAHVEWGNFTTQELLSVAEQTSPRIAQRLQTEQSVEATDIVPSGVSPLPKVLVDSRIKKALHHPAMWQAFLWLEDELREKVLDGIATDELARKFIKRFLTRAARRQADFPEEDEMLKRLRSVAQHSSNRRSEHYDRTNDWIIPASSNIDHIGVGVHYASMLYKEALSAGLIELYIPGIWDWQHPFVREYLAKW